MKELRCTRCNGNQFHPITTGSVQYYDIAALYNPSMKIDFIPNKRVFVCIGCGRVADGVDEPPKVPLYVVSNSISKASSQLKTAGIELSKREAMSLDKMAILVTKDLSVARQETVDKIMNTSPQDLAGFDIKRLNTKDSSDV